MSRETNGGHNEDPSLGESYKKHFKEHYGEDMPDDSAMGAEMKEFMDPPAVAVAVAESIEKLGQGLRQEMTHGDLEQAWLRSKELRDGIDELQEMIQLETKKRSGR